MASAAATARPMIAVLFVPLIAVIAGSPLFHPAMLEGVERSYERAGGASSGIALKSRRDQGYPGAGASSPLCA
jgi:hypothetical protein